MAITSVMPSLAVDDLTTSVTFYTRLLGKEPDRNPMEGTVEWDLSTGGGLQLSTGITARGQTVILGVDDVDAEADAVRARGLDTEPSTEPSGMFRLAPVEDPAGNTVLLVQRLAG